MRGFSAEYVSPQHFVEKDWYEPMRNGVRWFYHRPRGAHRRVTPEVLDATLDAVLRPVVFAARNAGLATLPSCAGHAVDHFHTIRLYQQLKRDSADIRGLGLPLVNVETGQKVIWQDPTYRLPWRSAESLEADLRVNEWKGAIGLTGPRWKLARVASSLLSVPLVDLTEDRGALWIWVHTPGESWQNRTWLAVAEMING